MRGGRDCVSPRLHGYRNVRRPDDVHRALQHGMRLLLVHERDPGRGAVEFDELFVLTPAELLHVYSAEIAIPMFHGTHKALSRQLLFLALQAEAP